MSFGSELRAEREKRGVELDAISAATKVSERQLRALETDAHGELPGGLFNRGFVRAYCRHLGLDEETWVKRFVDDFETETGDPEWAAFAENVRKSRVGAGRTGPRWWGVVLMVAMLAGLGWAVWHFVLAARIGSDGRAHGIGHSAALQR